MIYLAGVAVAVVLIVAALAANRTIGRVKAQRDQARLEAKRSGQSVKAYKRARGGLTSRLRERVGRVLSPRPEE
jgi:hypothetical protein